MEITLTDQNFEKEILMSRGVCLVDFWAPWCGPCRMLAPTIESIAKAFHGQLKVAKLNVDDAPMMASQYGVMSIPTLMVFKDGRPVETRVGVSRQEQIIAMFKAYLPERNS